MVPLVVLFSSFERGHVGRLQSGADVLTGHFYQAFNFLSLTRSLLVRQDWGGCVAIYTIIITATDRLAGRTEGIVAERMEAKTPFAPVAGNLTQAQRREEYTLNRVPKQKQLLVALKMRLFYELLTPKLPLPDGDRDSEKERGR